MLAKPLALLTAAALLASTASASYADETRDSISASVGKPILRVHAAGAQLYECKPDTSGKLVWQFREPIASLMRDGKTVGRHFAGPAWQWADGSLVAGKVAAKAEGASSSDIPWLRLTVTDHSGEGALTSVTTVQRINTVGGVKSGACTEAGTLSAEPYAADYIFSAP